MLEENRENEVELTDGKVDLGEVEFLAEGRAWK